MTRYTVMAEGPCRRRRPSMTTKNEPDRTIAGVEVFASEAAANRSREFAGRGFLGKTLYAVLTELAGDVDQVTRPFAGNEVDGVGADAPTLLKFQVPRARDGS